MTALEFVIVLAWVLAPGFLIGVAILAVSHRRNPGRPIGRTVGAAFALAFISVCVALGLMFFVPAGLGRYVGLRDTPFMWAPFAFIAVALAMPVALWLAKSGKGEPYKSFDTDAQALPCAAFTRIPCAGQVRRLGGQESAMKTRVPAQ